MDSPSGPKQHFPFRQIPVQGESTDELLKDLAPIEELSSFFDEENCILRR
jgi:hypothetical protein